jgi:predicted acetyltransferase
VETELALVLREIESAAASMWGVLTYRFDVRLVADGTRVGHINLRVDPAGERTRHVGHIGYGIDEPHRGHGYAGRACRLLLPTVAACGIDPVWITCAPDNPASMRTLQRLGAELVEVVDVPADYSLPPGVPRQKCRYRLATGRPVG